MGHIVLHEHDDAGSCQGEQEMFLLVRLSTRPGPDSRCVHQAQATPLDLDVGEAKEKRRFLSQDDALGLSN